MPGEDSKIMMGWSMILIASINTIFNFGLVLKAGGYSLFLVVKWYRRFRRFLDPDFMREKKSV